MKSFQPDFLLELFKLCIRSKNAMDTVIQYLDYPLLPDQYHKKLWKKISEYYRLNNSLPSIGVLSQKFEEDEEVTALLLKMRDLSIGDKQDDIITTFEEYIKRTKFIKLFNDTRELFEQGDADKAYNKLKDESEEIVEFSIKEHYYDKIYQDFPKRMEERKNREEEREYHTKVPTGIPQFDHYSNGGIEMGTSCLFIGRSGGGKSTALKWLGLSAAQRGYRVVHFQAEGRRDQAIDAYDAGWTGVNLHNMKMGTIPQKSKEKLEKTREHYINKGGEIFVIAFEQFGKASIADCRKQLIEIEKTYGKIHYALFDYLEKFDPGDGRKYPATDEGQRWRKEAVAEKITNVATELFVASASATQSNDIPPEKRNDPEFVITRSNVSNLRATVNPFSYVATLNQTEDEYESQIVRIYLDKLRENKAGQIFKVYQAIDTGRFVNMRKTLEYFWDNDAKRPL